MRHGTGLFSLSADPIHFGHLNVIRRAAKACENLIVLVSNSDGKDYVFNLATRLQMVKRAILHHIEEKNIKVIGSDELLVDVFLREGCDMMFRGVRDGEDRRFEEAQMNLHSRILPGFSGMVRYLDAHKAFQDVSSTLVRSFASKGLDISDMVPLFVKSRMERKVLNRYLVGVTGQMGTGKTYVAEMLGRWLASRNVPAMNLNLDVLVRNLYVEQTQGADRVREKLAELLGPTILSHGGSEVNPNRLKEMLAQGKIPPDTLKEMHNITAPHVYRLMRECMAGARGVVLLEWAQLIENDMCSLVNNDVIVVEAPEKYRKEFLKKRGVDPALAERFKAEQWDTDRKVAELNKILAADDCGVCLRYENVPGRQPDTLGLALLKLFPELESVRGDTG